MRTGERRRRLPWWLIVVVIILAFIIYSAIPKPVAVDTAVVSEGVLQLFLSSTGVVEGEVSDVSPRITARITQLYMNEGDRVTKGQAIAQLESADVQAEVDKLQAAVRAAEQDVASIQRSAASESGQLRAAVSRASANLQAARENLRQVEAGSRTEDIESQRAVVIQARAQAEDAHRRYERAQQLYDRGAISAQDRDTARANSQSATAQVTSQEQVLRRLQAGARPEEVQAARAQVRAAEASLREAQSGLGLSGARSRDVAAARERLQQARAALQGGLAQQGYTTIRSPVTGIVARRHREVGETVSPVEPIYTVANLDNIWIIAEVDEEDVASTAPGQKVSITVNAYPGRSAAGTVTRVSGIAEPRDVGRVRSKIVRTRVDIDNSSIPLRPGMEVNITGSLPAGRRTLLVPNDAVVRVGETDSVYVIEGNTAQLRNIEIGQSNFEDTQVVSGLQEGEVLAVSNLDKLKDGARVKVEELR
ncbi:MAG: efflux RND transporter periplasmic adaptor subunit [Armatimonadota bacterium]